MLTKLLGTVHKLISADQPLLDVAQWLDTCLLTLVADLSRLLFAVLDVVVPLGMSLHLELVGLLWFVVVGRFLDSESVDVGELLAVPVHVKPTYLILTGKVKIL